MNHWLAMLTNCHLPRRSAAHIGQKWPLLVCVTEHNPGRFAHIPLRPGQQETLALLKILALGNQDVAAGKVKPVADVVARLRAKRAAV